MTYGIASRLRGLFSLTRVPDVIEPHWAFVAQRRVKPTMVVERQRVDHLVQRLALRGKSSAMQASHLQAAPQAFSRSIVPTVGLATHRTAHAIDGPCGLEGVTAVLAASDALLFVKLRFESC